MGAHRRGWTRRGAGAAIALAGALGLSGCALLGPVDLTADGSALIARFTDPRTGPGNRSWVIEADPEHAAVRVHAHDEFLHYARVDVSDATWKAVDAAAEAAQERTNLIPEQGCEGARVIEIELWRGDHELKTLNANNCGTDDTYYNLYTAVTAPLVDAFDHQLFDPTAAVEPAQPRTVMSWDITGPPRP